MSETNRERLYNLLPAIYRQRDQAQGEPLRALMAGLESEFLTLEADMDALYDNWFIETCEEWVVPYLGDNVGIYSLSDNKTLFASQRRQVANTIAYRRRKGITAILEHVAQDATGWYVHAVEYARLLAGTQHLASVHAEQGKFVDFHQAVDLDALAGPFDPLAHTIDLRHVGTAATEMPPKRSTLPGLYQPHTIGLFIWRLQSYLMNSAPVGIVTSKATSDLPAACFTFDPLKGDMQLFNLPQPLLAITEKSTAVNVPGSISRVAFANDLKEYTKLYAHMLNEERAPQNSAYYGPDRSLCVLLNGKPVPPSSIVSADLSRWHVSTQRATQEGDVAIDTNLGRLRLLGEHPLDKIESIEVNYCYAFSSDLGGGPYTRELPSLSAQTEPYYIYVLKGGKINTLRGALDAWNAYYAEYEQAYAGKSEKPPCIGVIHILDNSLYAENDLVITMSKDSQLVIEAADGFRPILHVQGNLAIVGMHTGANLLLNGLLIDGKLAVQGSLKLDITHCTLKPHGIVTQHSSASAAPLQITIEHSIVGSLHLRNERGTLSIQDSIVDHTSGYAIDALQTKHGPGPVVSLERVTVFGKVRVQAIRIVQDVLFTEPIVVNKLQDGLIRFSYVPEHSQTPRRESCQPDLARLQQSSQPRQAIAGNSEQESGEIEPVIPWQSVYPLFLSTRYGDPAYAQLSMQCASQIRRGASEGSEMGVFHELCQAQRRDNLLRILEEYLLLSLNAGVLYVS